MTLRELKPVDPRDAFTVQPRRGGKAEPPPAAAVDTESVAASQAALLLAVRAGMLGQTPTTERIRGFRLPDTKRLQRRERIPVKAACKHLGVSRRELEEETHPDLRQEMTRVAREIYERPSFEAGAALFEAALTSPHPLVAVAAAAGARESTRLRPKIREILERGVRSRDPLVSRLALTAVSQIGPMEPLAKRRLVERPKSRLRRRWSRTAVITHGTFAANSSWYRPGGGFYRALDMKRPDLHLHDRSFRWTGAYSDMARRADARLLQQWITDQRLARPDLFAHSHGGTVAALATRGGTSFDRLVLMGWPVHERWFPDFGRVRRIIDVRVRLDLVIMLDLGRQRFRTRQFVVEEHRNGWFDHSSTREPAYWDKHGLWDVV